MTWEIIYKESYVLYINRVIDLKVKIIFGNEEDAYYINYKGYNIAATMLIWEFGEDLDLASLYDVHFVEESPSNNHFILSKKDKDKFLEEVYFFLIDNNIDSVLKEKYRVDW